MKKRIMGISLIISLFLFPVTSVFAASASGSIKVSSSSTVVGNSGSAILTISSDVPIAQIWGTFSCDGLGKVDLSYSATSSPGKSKSYTINWKATKTGTYTCSVSGLEVGILDGSDTGAWPSVSVAPKTIKVISATNNSGGGSSSGSSGGSGGTTADKKEYSKNNNLSSLSIEDYDLEPKFDKDTTEYKVKVDQSVEKIKIKAKAEDSEASVSGDGEVNLSLGENTIEVKVTAENGNEKKYKIIVSVEDLNPIEVSVDKKKYTIVKKNNDLIDVLENFEEKIIKIDEQEVVSYYNSNTKVSLVILKDEDNKIGYYIYDDKNSSYEKYRYIKVGNVDLQLLDSNEKLDNFNKYSVTIGEESVDIYKIKKSSKIGLIYGTNNVSGNTGYYVYDKNEDTLSRYYDDEIDIYKNENIKLKNIIMGLIGGFSLVIIIFVVVSLIKGKKKRHRF